MQAEEARIAEELASRALEMEEEEEEEVKEEEEEVELPGLEVRPQDATQVEEILRLEREIEELQRQKEQQELSLTEASLQRLQRLRDDELRRLEEEACRAAQEFLQSLNFDEIDECVRHIESSLGTAGGGGEKGPGPREEEEEEVDEGFGADDEAFKDSPNPSEHGHSDGQRTSGIRTSDDSSEEDPYVNDRVPPPPPAPPLSVPQVCHSTSSSADSAYCRLQGSEAQDEGPMDLIPPDEDSDYDQDDYDEGAIVSAGSLALSNPRSGQWSPDYRCSVGTYNSSGAYRFSSEGAQSSVSATLNMSVYFRT